MYLSLYLIALLAHMAAFYYGVRCIKAGEHLFVVSKPGNLFTSRVEQKYWTVCLGVLSNFILIPVLATYILSPGMSALGHMNFPFSLFHALDGLVTLIWHRITLGDLQSGRLGAANV